MRLHSVGGKSNVRISDFERIRESEKKVKFFAPVIIKREDEGEG